MNSNRPSNQTQCLEVSLWLSPKKTKKVTWASTVGIKFFESLKAKDRSGSTLLRNLTNKKKLETKRNSTRKKPDLYDELDNIQHQAIIQLLTQCHHLYDQLSTSLKRFSPDPDKKYKLLKTTIERMALEDRTKAISRILATTKVHLNEQLANSSTSRYHLKNEINAIEEKINILLPLADQIKIAEENAAAQKKAAFLSEPLPEQTNKTNENPNDFSEIQLPEEAHNSKAIENFNRLFGRLKNGIDSRVSANNRSLLLTDINKNLKALNSDMLATIPNNYKLCLLSETKQPQPKELHLIIVGNQIKYQTRHTNQKLIDIEQHDFPENSGFYEELHDKIQQKKVKEISPECKAKLLEITSARLHTPSKPTLDKNTMITQLNKLGCDARKRLANRGFFNNLFFRKNKQIYEALSALEHTTSRTLEADLAIALLPLLNQDETVSISMYAYTNKIAQTIKQTSMPVTPEFLKKTLPPEKINIIKKLHDKKAMHQYFSKPLETTVELEDKEKLLSFLAEQIQQPIPNNARIGVLAKELKKNFSLTTLKKYLNKLQEVPAQEDQHNDTSESSFSDLKTKITDTYQEVTSCFPRFFSCCSEKQTMPPGVQATKMVLESNKLTTQEKTALINTIGLYKESHPCTFFGKRSTETVEIYKMAAMAPAA